MQTKYKNILFAVLGLVIIILISVFIFAFVNRQEGEPITKTIVDDLFPILENILPIKTTTDTINNVADGITETITGEEKEEPVSRVFNGPVADFDFITDSSGEYLVVLDDNQKHIHISKLYENKFQRINNQTQYGETEIKVLTNNINKKSVVARTNKDIQKSDLTYVDFINLASSTTKNINQKISNITTLENKIITFTSNPTQTGTLWYNNNFDFSIYSLIFKTPFTSFDLKSADKRFFVGGKPSSFSKSYWYKFDFKINNLEKVLEGFGLVVNPSPDGQKILYSTNQIGKIYLYDLVEKKTSSFNVATVADKCAWFKNDQTKIVCGVPKNIPQSTVWPDDWYKGKVATTDSLYFIGITKLEIRKFTTDIDNLNIDIDKIKISNNGYNILLRNKKDNGLWSVKLY